MTYKRTILIIILLFAAAIVYLLAQNRETLFQETIRFYSWENIMYEGFSDDTSFETISDKHIDVEFNVSIAQGAFSFYYIDGTIKIGDEEFYVTSASTENNLPGKMAHVKIKGHNRLDPSTIRFSDDLKHIELILDNSSTANGFWINSSTLEEYKKGMKSLYNIELQ